MLDDSDTVARRMIEASTMRDRERAHVTADETLIDALRLAARGGLTAEDAEAIIAIYEEIPKWYA